MARWFYGEPNYEAIKEELRFKRIILGGCCISDASPKWVCETCCFSYRSDGIGYLDGNLIEKRIHNSFHNAMEVNKKHKPLSPYRLPEKIQTLLNDDFLEKIDSNNSIGFHFHQGGYMSPLNDVFYLDGILLYNYYEDFLDPRLEKDGTPKLPDTLIVLSKAAKNILEHFITTSNWKKNYDSDFHDGIQWEMKRYFHNSIFKKKTKKSYGSNVYPEVYNAFFDILENLNIPIQRHSND